MKRLVLALALIAGSMPTYGHADVPQEIANYCKNLWGDDYEMRLYCQNKQMAAKAAIESQVTVYGPSPKPDGYEASESRCHIVNLNIDELYKCDDTLRRVDRQMNEAYRKIMRRLPVGQRERLRERQRTWIFDRNYFCKVKEWGERI
jgi:uncharacterized protein YecT (DUF1311 family)